MFDFSCEIVVWYKTEEMKKLWPFGSYFCKTTKINFLFCSKESVTRLNELVLDQPMLQE